MVSVKPSMPSYLRYLLVLVVAVAAVLLPLLHPLKRLLPKLQPQLQSLQLLHQVLPQPLHQAHATVALDSHAVDRHVIAQANIPASELAFAQPAISSVVSVKVEQNDGI